MKTLAKPRIAALAMCITLLLFGEISYAKKTSSAWKAILEIIFTAGGHALPADIIDARTDIYEKLLADATLSAKNRETAEALLGYYRKIQSALTGDVSEEYYREIIHQLFDSMLLLENSFIVPAQASAEAEVLEVEKDRR